MRPWFSLAPFVMLAPLAACSSAQPSSIDQPHTDANPPQSASASATGAPAQASVDLVQEDSAEISCVLTCEGKILQTFTTSPALCNNGHAAELMQSKVIAAVPRCFYQIEPAQPSDKRP